MNRYKGVGLAVVFVGLTSLLFQNCAKELDESKYNTSKTESTSMGGTNANVIAGGTITTTRSTTTDTNTSTNTNTNTSTSTNTNTNTITGVAPTITSSPGTLYLSYLGNLSAAVTASGTGPLSYTWYKDGVALVESSRISGNRTNRSSVPT